MTPQPLSVVVVEDSEHDSALLLVELRRRGFVPTARRVDTAHGLEAALAEGGWDLVLSDHHLPGFSGLDALQIVKRLAPDLPFIMVSGTIGEEYAVEAMRAGASDFIIKDRLNRLAPAVERELREAEQRREQWRTTQALASSQEQLRQAQKLEAIGRLAGGVAHDFNNLLTAVLGYAELVLESLPPDDARRPDIEEIRRAGEKAVGLTRQLLAFSRRQVLDPRVLDLNDVVRDVERLLRRVIGEDIGLEVRLGDDLWPVKADRTQIEQILMNLAVNARDAMPDGGRLTIETSNVEIHTADDPTRPGRPGRYVALSMRDTGHGIPEDVLPKIFEPFFTTKEAGKGTGLGLSMVYGIVQQSDGFVFAQSTPGQGAAFTAYLPETLEREDAEPRTASGAPPAGGAVILLVEDDSAVRDLAAKVLTQHGYHVIATADPIEALHAAQATAGRLDLLLTDVVMPGMDGPSLARRILEARPALRVVFMSGFTGEITDKLRTFGPTAGFLSKPFTAGGLAEKVREALVGGSA
jgi:two-component system, cell cycle sensor histidine kinase and response regulator CckA